MPTTPPLRILILNWQDRTNPMAGGAEIHLHEVFGRVAAHGHEVVLLTSSYEGAAPIETVDGMEVHRTGGRHSYAIAAPLYYRRHFATRPFDVVIEDLNKIPLFTTRWIHHPLVLLVHHLFGTTAFASATPPVAALTWLLERPIGRMYRNVPIEAVSESTADDLVARGLSRAQMRIIHNGVDDRFFTPSADTPRDTAPMFLYLGRLQKYKRVDLVIRGFAAIAKSHPTARLVIAGRGAELDALRQLAQSLGVGDRTEFAGYVTEEVKRTLYRRAWANVFTSPKEGWGITNLEAGACGTPTIASDSPGLRDSVVNEGTGLLVPHGDVAALGAAMGRLAADRQLVERLGAAARQFAETHAWDRAAEVTEAHLVEVMAQFHRRDQPAP